MLSPRHAQPTAVAGARSAWAFGGASLLLGVVYALLSPSLAADVLYVLARVAVVAAIVAGVRRHRPRDPAAWWALAAGAATFTVGTVVFGLSGMLGDGPPPFPSPADLCYLAAYPLWALGLGRFARARRRGDARGVLDACIVALAAALLVWVFLVEPYAADRTVPLAERLVAVAYPVADVLVLGVAARLAFGPGALVTALRLLGGGLTLLLVADLGYTVQRMTASFQTGNVLSLGWYAFFALWGTAALHPSMTALTEPQPEPGGLRIHRLLAVTAGVVAIPAVTFVQSLRGVQPDLRVLAPGWLLVVALGMVRVVGILGDLEQTLASLRRVTRRERVLRDAGTRLVAAATPEQLYDAALAAALELADGVATGAAVRVVAGGTTRIAAQRGSLEPVEDWGETVALPLRSGRRAFRAELVLGVVGPLSVAAREGLEALTAQVSLALESAAHVEQRHRRAGEARFRSLVQHASDVIAIIDRDAVIRYLSPAVETIFGYRPEQLLGTAVLDTVHPDDVDAIAAALADVVGAPWKSTTVEGRLRAADGSWRWFESSVVNLVEDPNVAGVVLTTRDVSDRRALEEQLRHQAFHDPLTGLANRALFSDRVDHALARRRDDGEAGVAVVFVDLDDFKTVNDSLGHEVGDALLVTAAQRIADSIRAGDTAARLGGDEFAVLVEDADHDAVGAVVDRILTALRQPVTVGGAEVVCSASVGVAIGGPDDSATVLLRNADVAMYAAKAAGKGRAELFSPAMHTAALTRLQLKADLQRALDRGELAVHYQPIVALETGEITGLEALARWQHPGRGLVGPAGFIPLAEETGLILSVGARVLAVACRAARDWQEAFPRAKPLGIGVNLSAKEFTDARLADTVAAVLEQTGLAPDSLVIELTESVLVADLDATAARLAALRALHVQVALDDFGTGYSSLSYLHRFPVDFLKVDRSFVARLGGEHQDAALTRGIIRFAGTLGITVVAEGVETAEQVAALRSLGCPLGQGFLLGAPVPAEDVPRLLSGSAAGGPAGGDGS